MKGENYQDCHDCSYWYMGGCWKEKDCPKGKQPYYIKCSVCGVPIVNDGNTLCKDCKEAILKLRNIKEN